MVGWWLALAGCGGGWAPREPVVGPLDDVLRLHHVQALGTHNSYHAGPLVDRPEWQYAHLPLWEQALRQGVRQFELDLYPRADGSDYDVLHVPVIDAATTCPTWRACLWSLRVWSDSRPDHHPILTLIEPKFAVPEDPAAAEAALALVEDALLEVWPRERLITPDDVRGEAPTLREALEPDGWPVLAGLRGRAIFVLHASDWGEVYTGGGEDLPGRPLFVDARGDLSAPYAAVHTANDPVDDAARIASILAAGHLVRTRADADVWEAAAGDTARRDAAFASGATFVSTDFPAPHPDTGYVVAVPGGSPSRCNPVTAPAECTAAAIEGFALR